MPYVTREMADYMKDKGLSNADDSQAGSQVEKRKIRELPSSVEPSGVEESEDASTVGKTGGPGVSGTTSKSGASSEAVANESSAASSSSLSASQIKASGKSSSATSGSSASGTSESGTGKSSAASSAASSSKGSSAASSSKGSSAASSSKGSSAGSSSKGSSAGSSTAASSSKGSSAASSAASSSKGSSAGSSTASSSKGSSAGSSTASSSKGSSATSSKGSSATSSKGSSATSSKGSSAASSSKGSSAASSSKGSSAASSAHGSKKSSAHSSSGGSKATSGTSKAGSKATSGMGKSKTSSSHKGSSAMSKSGTTMAKPSSQHTSNKGSSAGSKAGSHTSNKGGSTTGSKVNSKPASSFASNVGRVRLAIVGSKKPAKTGSQSLVESKFHTEKMSFNEKMLKYTVGLLRSNITRLLELDGAVNADQSREYQYYKINFSKNVIPPECLRHCDAVVEVKHRNKEFRDFPLCCKIYDRSKRNLEPQNEYLKILRFLARKHPSIAQTWAIFFNDQQILVITEFFAHDSLFVYLVLREHDVFHERKTSEMTQQLAKALDYLGDVGISHRALSPQYVMIAHRDPIRVKLSGFHAAIIYWDVQREYVNLVPCVSLSRKPQKPEFQAPEVYGDEEKEAFDPIHADCWSFGATIYFMLTKEYPYDFSRENPQIEEEIQTNIQSLKISSTGKDFLGKTLCTNAEVRMRFDQMFAHRWLTAK